MTGSFLCTYMIGHIFPTKRFIHDSTSLDAIIIVRWDNHAKEFIFLSVAF
ncbi:hypothetical protein SAMN05421676_110126 [Salinibacillus kushneri]|uniref:Uncharacterized protein n=1 Tax=Salinibacillus kushneri TaxID=237682 RepID=A0A1I0I392_9BACI|nr:hypothetical protein SAMN05421676_110126 [Salinibacillus kushneri]